MNLWHRVNPADITPERFLACVEIPQGSKNKYEIDKYSGALKLDRILYTSTHYPHNYGFIPKTFADDGDALDVMIISSEPIVPLALVECRPIGVLEMIDGGDKDAKILAVAVHDPFFKDYEEASALPQHILDEIKHFFQVYKQLEGKKTVVDKVGSKETAMKVIEVCIEAYNEKIGDRPDLRNKGK